MSSGVIVFVEGDTDKEFFDSVINTLRSYTPTGKFSVDKLIVRNLKGIGNYKSRLKRVFLSQIVPENPGVSFVVALCYDTDVFDYASKPPINWTAVEDALLKTGAIRVIHIKAHRSIEDWFLLDKRGVLKHLKLAVKTQIPSGNGIKILENLYRKAGKVYVKGAHAKGLVAALNTKLVLMQICKEIKPLCNALGIKCNKKSPMCK